jgi:hypothetical protein
MEQFGWNIGLLTGNGPAVIWYDTNGEINYTEYFINGNSITDPFQKLMIETA